MKQAGYFNRAARNGLRKEVSHIFYFVLLPSLIFLTPASVLVAQQPAYQTYRHFTVEEASGQVVSASPVIEQQEPLWAKNVSGTQWKWKKPRKATAYFASPVPFVLPPQEGSGEPFYSHNHEPSITWLKNGDLLAIWFSTVSESGTEMTVLASRLRAGHNRWDSSSEFFKAKDRNMTGMSLYTDPSGKIYHFNSMGQAGIKGWAKLAILMRTSIDNGISWTAPAPIVPAFKGRHQVIDGVFRTSGGLLIQPCDANPGASGGTALMISKDNGISWYDPGEEKPVPQFTDHGKGEGTIAGIHGHAVELKDGSLLAFGRSDNINGRMPVSISRDMGNTWEYSASEFPPIGGGQRIVLVRLHEGPILLISFTNHPKSPGQMAFKAKNGGTFEGHGMFAALSYDEGKTWPVRKLITPGEGEYDCGGWTGHFKATPTQAEPAGYLAATQSPDNMIHLISSRLYYRFNLKWLETLPDMP